MAAKSISSSEEDCNGPPNPPAAESHSAIGFEGSTSQGSGSLCLLFAERASPSTVPVCVPFSSSSPPSSSSPGRLRWRSGESAGGAPRARRRFRACAASRRCLMLVPPGVQCCRTARFLREASISPASEPSSARWRPTSRLRLEALPPAAVRSRPPRRCSTLHRRSYAGTMPADADGAAAAATGAFLRTPLASCMLSASTEKRKIKRARTALRADRRTRPLALTGTASIRAPNAAPVSGARTLRLHRSTRKRIECLWRELS